MREFIASLDLPEDDRQRLLDMTPGSYTGLAGALAKAVWWRRPATPARFRAATASPRVWSKSSVRTSTGRWTSTCCWASSCFGGARASQSSIGRGSGCSSPKIRSEEHTSELQSLMHISYAVFCLKKKTQIIKTNREDKTKH